MSNPITSTLRGKCAIITGASRGIGAAIATRFAQEGAQCIFAGRNEELLLKVKNSVNDRLRNQNKHHVVVGDVANEEFWNQFKKHKIDILVNAAGISHSSPLFVTSLGLIQEVIQTNLVGTILGCRIVGKNMLAGKGGCIINIASLLGLKGGRGSTAYAASKAGVIGLTRSLATELEGKNIRVNVIVPGYVETDMTKALISEARKKAIENIPLRRFGHAEEIADAAVFLACNTYANNCVLNIDGGMSAI